MRWKKTGLLLIILFIISIFLVSCTSDEGEGGFSLNDVWGQILSIGNLEFLGFSGENALVGFMRILVGILVFAILFELGRLVELSRNVGIVIPLILAIISVIFIPGSILAGIGGAYGTIVAFVLIGIPVLGGGYALYRIPSSNRGLILLKIAIIILLIWILMAVKSHAEALIGM